jgi:hypothetical protein
MAALPVALLLRSIVICALITESHFVHSKVIYYFCSIHFIVLFSNAKFRKKHFPLPYTDFTKYFLFINASEMVFSKEITFHRT